MTRLHRWASAGLLIGTLVVGLTVWHQTDERHPTRTTNIGPLQSPAGQVTPALVGPDTRDVDEPPRQSIAQPIVAGLEPDGVSVLVSVKHASGPELESAFRELVLGSTVELRLLDTSVSEAKPRIATLSSDAIAHFLAVPPGMYYPAIDLPKSTGAFVAPRPPPPHAMEARDVAGIAPTIAVSGETAEISVEVLLLTPGRLEVYVPRELDPGSAVQVRSRIPEYASSAQSDVVGLDSVAVFEGVIPGPYRCEYRMEGIARREAYDSIFVPILEFGVLPAPVDCWVEAGQTTKVTIQLPTGEGCVTGSVALSTGGPLGGAEVLLYHKQDTHSDGTMPTNMSNVAAWTQTDSRGLFAFEQVPSGSYAVQIEPYGFLPRRPASENTIGAPVPVVAFQLSPAQNLDVGRILVTPSTTVVVTGQLIVPALDARQLASRTRLVRCRVYESDPRLDAGGKIISYQDVEISTSGEFSAEISWSGQTCFLWLRGRGEFDGHESIMPFFSESPLVNLGPIGFP